MNKVHYLTADGLEKLKNELQGLKTVNRRDVASRIEAAKALGDLSENAEYHEAKEEMVTLENRISELEDVLKNYSVIESETGAPGVIHIGSKVIVKAGSKERSFIIVGSNESDPLAGRISNESPIGSALLGAQVGDIIDIKTPSGTTEYKIIAVN